MQEARTPSRIVVPHEGQSRSILSTVERQVIRTIIERRWVPQRILELIVPPKMGAR